MTFGALVIGVMAGGACYVAVQAVKHRLRVDDSLDVFAVHGVGGILGTLAIPFLAALGPGAPGLADGMTLGSQFGVQLLGVVAVCAWSLLASIAILFIVKPLSELRVTSDVETEGLDVATHGERGYNL